MLDSPFLLLPFRPDSDPSGARAFIRNFFKSNGEGLHQYRGAYLQQELKLTEPIVLCSIIKWCWSRIPNGVVSWPVYDGFRIGEDESNMARNAFHTFIPISVESPARKNIIFDFFDLLAAVAAHGKTNGLGGRKLSRLAGWWAFEHSDDGKGFEGGYKSWTGAADASSHLFFAYLRSLSPEADPSMSVIERIPRSLQALLAQTEYPPETPELLQRSTPRVVMIVDTVSPTPFALLRRAKHFEYRDNDRVLREYSEFEDPVDALTEENKRVLYAISSINSSKAARSQHGRPANNPQQSWSAFQNMGFSDMPDSTASSPTTNGNTRTTGQGLRSAPRSRNADHGRPTTPSWADFLSTGFAEDDNQAPNTLLLPPDKILPPIGSRTQTPTQSNFGKSDGDDQLRPGELAAITNVELDDAFWWVWMTSLAGEEPNERKAVFGRCALIETSIMHGSWLIMEEQVKGASPDPVEGAHIVEKKSRFGFTKRGRLGKRKESEKKPASPPQDALDRTTSATPSKSSIGPDQQAKIRAAAAQLARKPADTNAESNDRRGRYEDASSMKTNSVLTMGLQSEAGPAMKWANSYDKSAIRAAYLGDNFAGKGASRDDLSKRASYMTMSTTGDSTSAPKPALPVLSPTSSSFAHNAVNRDLPALPPQEAAIPARMDSLPRPSQQTSAPEPAPLPPKAPEVIVQPVEEQRTQHEAEHVPLPQTTINEAPNPMERDSSMPVIPTSPKLGKVERKPVPRISNPPPQVHPAFRQESLEEPRVNSPPEHLPPRHEDPAVLAARQALESKQSSSPESQKFDNAHKLRNQGGGGGGGGLKKLFGRKKDNPNRNSIHVQNVPNRNGLAPPSESNLGRRLSMMRRKPAASATPKQSQVSVAPSEPEPAIETAHEPVMPGSYDQYKQSRPDMSRVDTQDRQDAEHAFSRFDQGPLQDMPAELPSRSSIDDDAPTEEPPSQPRYNTRAAALLAPQRTHSEMPSSEEFATPMERGDPTNDVESEASIEIKKEAPPPAYDPSDRWAKIKENAARRAARANERASEEQSLQSRPSQAVTDRTEDGETSGEESESLPQKSTLASRCNNANKLAAIESRVARIKARVAELTGGMETNAAAMRR